MTPRENSAGAVVFRKEGKRKEGKIFYLVLHYHFKGDYWDFARGKIEGRETEEETAKREVKEETGLDTILIKGFRKATNWYYRWKGNTIYKTAIYFLAEAKKKEVKISHEHLEYKWLEYGEAMEMLTYDNTKEILKAAHKFLKARLDWNF